VTPACRRQPTSTIRYAIRAARKMRITYQDADGRGTERVIQPIAVAHYVGATLICAWCELRNDVRHFRADRVVSADVLDESFCTDVTAVGTRFFVQGFFRDGLDFQGLAVDTTGGRGLGNVYITWQDGRNLNQTDPFGFVGVGGTGGCPVGSPPGPGYCFGDVLFTRSLNGGATWSAPVRINDDPISLKVDQMFPAVEVDKDGAGFHSVLRSASRQQEFPDRHLCG
jgi:hypothetical protein